MKDFKNALLVSMATHQRAIGLGRYFEPKDAAAQFGLTYIPGQIRLCASDFKAFGYINSAFTIGGGQDGGLSSQLTATGFEAAEELEASYPELTQVGRYQKTVEVEAQKIVCQVGQLRELVKQNRDNDFPTKDGCIGELLALELLVIQPLVSTPLVEKILRETVAYLAQKFSDQAIGIAATSLLVLAAGLLGIKIVH